jgi:hypothetical protein
MFYARINKIKVFNNREGFPGLFNRAELRIYSYAANPTGVSGHFLDGGVDYTLFGFEKSVMIIQ